MVHFQVWAATMVIQLVRIIIIAIPEAGAMKILVRIVVVVVVVQVTV